MIILEFLVFVVSSGLFCSERFRTKLWAVLSAGVIATGSSLLFVYDLGAKLAGHENQPPVITKIVKQVVTQPGQSSPPASVGKAHACAQEYPAEARDRHEEGITSLAFRILSDGTVDAVKVLASSGSQILDDAAMKCVSEWHYRPAIKNGQIVDAPWTARIAWKMPSPQQTAAGSNTETKSAPEPAPQAKEPETAEVVAPPKEHHWWDVTNWFGSDEEKKEN
jgi:TonB family protein